MPLKLPPNFIEAYRVQQQKQTTAAFPPDLEPAPPPAPAPDAPPPPFQFDTPIDDGGGQYKITPEGKVLFQAGGRWRPADDNSLPPNIKTARDYLVPPGDVFAQDGIRMRLSPGGAPMQFDPAVKQWYPLEDDEIAGINDAARAWMAQQLEPKQSKLYDDLRTQHPGYFGEVNPTPQQIEEARRSILTAANAQRGGKRGLQIGGYTIQSPEDLEAARQHAAQVGNQEQIAALKDIFIQPGAEGGYTVFTPSPNDKGQYIMQAVTPLPQKESVYNWTEDPAQMDIAARMRAETALRQQYEQQTGGARLNNDAVRVVQDYVKKFAPAHRSALLQGQMLGEPPERVAAALKSALDSGDRAGAQAAIAEMQNALADNIGGGYEYLKPDWSNMTALENGDQRDYGAGAVPPRQPENWETKTSVISMPKEGQQKNKEFNPVGVTWPTITGGEKPYAQSFNEMTAMSGVTPEAFTANHKFIRNQTYNNPDAPLQNPVIAGQQHPGNLRLDDAATMAVQKSLGANPQLVTGLKDAAIQSALHATSEMEQAAWRPEGYDAKGNPRGVKMTPKEYFEKQRELWGTHTTKGDLTPTQMDDAKVDVATGEVYIAGEPDAVTGKATRTVLGQTWNERTVMAAMNNGGYDLGAGTLASSAAENLGGVAQTIYNINRHQYGAAHPEMGKVPKPLFIDSRLKSIMPTLSRSGAAVLLPVMQELIRQNPGYFTQNIKQSRGEIPYIQGEPEQAAAYELAAGAMIKLLSESFKK